MKAIVTVTGLFWNRKLLKDRASQHSPRLVDAPGVPFCFSGLPWAYRPRGGLQEAR